ncbi:MAG: hypothetical protein IJI43_00940 [Bacilli bacterium]|nr:hypothetical protein [Bacilli bacterium]
MKKFIFIFISLLFLIPISTKAVTTYSVCDTGCDYNMTSFGVVLEEYNAPSLRPQDKVIFNIADGNYTINTGQSGYVTLYNVELNFGNGTYTFPNAEFVAGADNIKTVINGRSSSTTFVNIRRLQAGMSDYSHLTITADQDMSFDPNPVDADATVNMDDVILKTKSESLEDSASVIFGVNKLVANGLKVIVPGKRYYGLVLANPHSDGAYDDSDISITNSDFTDANVYIGASAGNREVVNIENTKLNKIYVTNSQTNIDCDSTFIGTMKYEKGTESRNHSDFSNFLDGGSYSIYEYRPLDNIGSGVVQLEACKDKRIIMDEPVSLNDIREESGYSIDNTWTIFPTGVVEIRDNSLVPLQLGKTKIYKLIDGELKSLRVEVVEDDEEPYNPDDSEEYNDDSSYDNKPIDKSTNNIVNPKTLNAIVIIIAFTVSVLGSTIYLMQRKSMN